MNEPTPALTFTRISEGTDGRSHFSEYAMPPDSSARTALSAVNTLHFRTSPEGRVVDYHVSLQRQWLLLLAGTLEVTCSDESRLFHPGAILFFDDLGGQGHRTVNVQGTRVLAHLHVPESFSVSAFERRI